MLKWSVIIICASVLASIFCEPGYENVREDHTIRPDALLKHPTTGRRQRQTNDVEFIQKLDVTELQNQESYVLSPLSDQTREGQRLRSEINSILASIDSKYNDKCSNGLCVQDRNFATVTNAPEYETVRNSGAYDYSNNYYDNDQYSLYNENRHAPLQYRPPSPPYHDDMRPPPPHHHRGPPPPPPDHNGPPSPPPHHHRDPPPPPPHHHRDPPPPPRGEPPPPHHHRGPPPPPPRGPPPPPPRGPPPLPSPSDNYESNYYDRWSHNGYYNRPSPPPQNGEQAPPRQYRGAPPPHGGPPPRQHHEPPPPSHHRGPPHRNHEEPSNSSPYGGPPPHHLSSQRGPPPRPQHGGPPSHFNNRPKSNEDTVPERFYGESGHRPVGNQPPRRDNEPDDRRQQYSNENNPSRYIDGRDMDSTTSNNYYSSRNPTTETKNYESMIDVRFADEVLSQTTKRPAQSSSDTSTPLSPFLFQAVAVTPE